MKFGQAEKDESFYNGNWINIKKQMFYCLIAEDELISDIKPIEVSGKTSIDFSGF